MRCLPFSAQAAAVKDLEKWVAIVSLAGALLAVGMWAGRLEQRIADIESRDRYLHGEVVVPLKGQKE